MGANLLLDGDLGGFDGLHDLKQAIVVGRRDGRVVQRQAGELVRQFPVVTVLHLAQITTNPILTSLLTLLSIPTVNQIKIIFERKTLNTEK